MNERLTEAQLDAELDDPLAIRVGDFVGVDDLPPEGWPETFKEAPVRRILMALGELDANGS